jgi:hypothetical protein
VCDLIKHAAEFVGIDGIGAHDRFHHGIGH